MIANATAAPHEALAPPSSVRPVRRFQPTLTLGYSHDLYALGARIAGSHGAERIETIRAAIAHADGLRADLLALGVAPGRLAPTVKYLAALRLLRDLVQQGWTARMDDEGIYLSPPVVAVRVDDPHGPKRALRESFSFARRAQLAEPSTRMFIELMERRGVAALFAHGPELAQRLKAPHNGASLAVPAIRPSLHLIDPEARDTISGLRLQDIWRYARHYWSIPFHTTPGRNLFYLVRDDAGPNQPIMGIAALGNAVLGLGPRDDELGWSARSLRDRLLGANDGDRLSIGRHMASVLRADIRGVYSDDLGVGDGPWTSTTVTRLRDEESDAAFNRRSDLKDAGDERSADYQLIRDAHEDSIDPDVDDVDWIKVAQTDLYRRKRAGTLADLIHAWNVLSLRHIDTTADGLLNALNDDRCRAACEVVLRRIKQRALAENLMEITTCGAVPPYGEVFAGKLTAMILTSPRVVRDVAERYAGRVSLIASGLAGQPVVRRPNLAVLTTSSLYEGGSNQYTRISVPATTVGQGSGRISYDRIGKTDSFGTVHFAPDTADALMELARLDDDNRRFVNHLFGEGTSPKLRAIRTGIEALGLDPDDFLRHYARRLLYAARLAHNTDDLLLGIADEPAYILKTADGSDGVSEIAAHWYGRWIEPRLADGKITRRLQDRANVALLSHDFEEVATLATDETPPDATTNGGGDTDGAFSSPSASEFIERLYRSSNSYADRLTAEELGWVDVDLGLNDHMRELAEAGYQIIVTGNPGDGKTHLIERLRPMLEKAGAVVLTDANILSDNDIINRWRECDDAVQPMVLAINEWPLFVLRRHPRATGFEPLQEALRQVQRAISYDAGALDSPAGKVRVIDLSLRNVLARPIVLKVIERLTDSRFYLGLSPTDPAVINRNAMRHERVCDRIATLLEEVARRGHHATMRQLVGFIAFMITSGVKDVDRLAAQGSQDFHYSQLAFAGGVGPLFEAVRESFDPSTVTHPRRDMDLWRGTTAPADWIDGIRQPAVSPLQAGERMDEYRPLKRRFFFEHRDGADLIKLLPADARRFDDLVAGGRSGSATVVRDLLLAINRFFEPDCPDKDRDRLILWQSHRFDVQAPETFLWLHDLPHGLFEIRPPRLAPWVESWLPPEQRLVRTFALAATTDRGATTAALLVDRALYLTLAEAHWGLGRTSWSRSATRRVTRFVDQVHGSVAATRSDVVDVNIRNVERDIEEPFEIQPRLFSDHVE